jgi:rubrerythrin
MINRIYLWLIAQQEKRHEKSLRKAYEELNLTNTTFEDFKLYMNNLSDGLRGLSNVLNGKN